MADVLVVNKADAAPPSDVEQLVARLRAVNARATITRGNLPVRFDDPAAVHGRRVLVVEDGPTLTHGGMSSGAGAAAAFAAGAAALVDPRSSAPAELMRVFTEYPHIGMVLPAMGYSEAQLAALAETIAGSSAEVVVSATPIDLASLIPITKPVMRARYEFAEDPRSRYRPSSMPFCEAMRATPVPPLPPAVPRALSSASRNGKAPAGQPVRGGPEGRPEPWSDDSSEPCVPQRLRETHIR
jgi:predicted GTPase